MFYAAVVLLVFIVNENISAQVPALASFYPDGPRYDRYFAVRHPLVVLRARAHRRKAAMARRRDAILYRSGTLERDTLMKVLIVLVTVGVAYGTLLCFVPETGWYSDVYPWAYQDVLETVRFWT